MYNIYVYIYTYIHIKYLDIHITGGDDEEIRVFLGIYEGSIKALSIYIYYLYIYLYM
jgi:hypothetical protein